MRILLALAILLSAVSSHAAGYIIRASITFTNYPTNGATITIQAQGRTWTNDVSSSPGTLITQTNSIEYSTTNLLNHLTTYPAVSGHQLVQSNATNVTIRGKPNETMAVTTSGGYATIDYFTNTLGTPTFFITAPRSVQESSNRQFSAQAIIDYLSLDSTNAVATNAVALTNYLSTGPHTQRVIGLTTFHYGVGGTNSGLTNGVIIGARATNIVGLHATAHEITGGTFIAPTITNAVITNVAVLQGYLLALTNGILDGTRITNVLAFNGTIHRITNGYWTNGILDDATATNLTTYGLIPLGSGTRTVQIGDGALATNDFATIIGDSARSLDDDAIVIGRGGSAGKNSIALGGGVAQGTNVTAIGFGAEIVGIDCIGIGTSIEFSGVTNSIVLGNFGTTTNDNQIVLGSSSHLTYVAGRLTGLLTNIAFAVGSTNQNAGDWADTPTTISSFANGTNRITATNVVIRIESGPTSAFSIAGIDGGRDGRVIELYNDTGQAMTINHESGVESVAANRIRTGRGADQAYGTNVYMTFRYIGAVSRWVVRTAEPSP